VSTFRVWLWTRRSRKFRSALPTATRNAVSPISAATELPVAGSVTAFSLSKKRWFACVTSCCTRLLPSYIAVLLRLAIWSKLVGKAMVTVTTERSKNGATTLSHMKCCGYVGHVAIFSWMLTTAFCLVVELGLGLDLASLDGTHVFILLSVVIVTLPSKYAYIKSAVKQVPVNFGPTLLE